jgi:phage shock protein PspC (stress-responsive transcriptional regulator)
VATVIAEVGPVDDGSSSAADDKAGVGPQPPKTDTTSACPPKRLYRITDGAMVSGVCNGLAAYLGVDVTLLRLAVVVLACFSLGTLLIAYFIARFVIPEAKTPEQKAAATGPSQTAHDFVRMAREGYYEGMKSFPDRQARREWKRKFRRDMRDLKHRFQWEMKENFGAWCHPAESTCPPCPPSTGCSVTLPFLSTLKALLFFLFVFAILSLIATGSIFGVPLPGGLPVWAGVILLLLAYKVAVAPIKAMRRACYFRSQGRPYYWHPLADLWQGFVTVCILVLFVFLADRFIPGFHHALRALPDFLHNVTDAVQQWWTRR